MKKIFIILLLIFVSSHVFAATAMYRISSNEVAYIDIDNGLFEEKMGFNIPGTYAVLEGASYPDGTAVRDESYPIRVLGIAKIVDGNVVRNATQGEIDTFIPAVNDDQNTRAAVNASRYMQNDPRFRRIMIAFADIIRIQVYDALREYDLELKAVIAASISLADFKSRVDAMDDSPERTLSQLRTAIQNRISKDD